MPIAKVRNVDLYYECHGQGPALLLIRGLGSCADHWYSQVPDLDLRHTFNSNMLKAGVEQAIIMKLTGHKTVSMF
jgi:integrase